MAATTPAATSTTPAVPAPVIAGSLTLPGQTRNVAEAQGVRRQGARSPASVPGHRRFTVL